MTLISVTDYGAVGNGTTLCTNECMDAIGAAGAGDIVYFPKGVYNAPNLVVPTYVRLVGASENGSQITSCGVDATIVTLNGQGASVERLCILGAGRYGSDDAIPTTFPAVDIADSGGNGAIIDTCRIFGGCKSLRIQSPDTDIKSTSIAYSYSPYGVIEIVGRGSVWARRLLADQGWPTGALPLSSTVDTAPAMWAATTSYGRGAVRRLPGGQVVQCISGGLSGSSAPAIKPYGKDIVDGAARWNMVNMGQDYCNIVIDPSVGSENFFEQCDFSACTYRGFKISTTNAYVEMSQCIISQVLTSAIYLVSAQTLSVEQCKLGAGLYAGYVMDHDGGGTLTDVCEVHNSQLYTNFYGIVAKYANTIITDNFISGPGSHVGVYGNANNLKVADNIFRGLDVSVQLAGAADHCSVTDNIVGSAVIVNGATGTNNNVAGNV